MTLKYEKRNLSQKEQKVFDDYYKPNDFELKIDEKYKSKNNGNVIKDVYESLNKSENNEKKKIFNYDNKFETNINEQKKNDLLNSKMAKLKSNNKNKVIFSTQLLDGQNQPYDCNMEEKKSSKKKRGRPKKSNDNRFHSKNDKDNIELKIYGLIIDSCRSFINKQQLKKKSLKILNYEEKLKFSMDKRLKDIYKNVSTRLKNNCNNDIIVQCDPILKEIFELPMYKVIQAISGVEINILKGLENEYKYLKDQKLLKEDDDYINLFNEIEASIINSATHKYPIIKENTKIEALNSKINIDINVISKNNAKISQINEFSNDKTTKAKTLDSKKNIDKTFIYNTNNEKQDIKEFSYQDSNAEALFLGQMPVISNINDKNEETDKFLEMPHIFNNNNVGDSESFSSKYSFINFQEKNDDMF